jgi:hypothetical protein
LELIRYIHLNPLRAKVVKDLKELDKYPWTGHSAILDRCKNHLIPNAKSRKNPRNPAPVNSRNLRIEKSLAEKTIEDVLLYFGDTLPDAGTAIPAYSPKA